MKQKSKKQLLNKENILIYSGFLLIPTKIPLLWGRSYSGNFSDPRFLIVMGLFVIGIILGLIFKNRDEKIYTKKNLSIIKASDPSFSKKLFLDFVSSIYTRYYSDEKFENLTPFLSDTVISKTNKNFRKKTYDLVSKRISIHTAYEQDTRQYIEVYIYAKYFNNHKKYKVKERWKFHRKAGGKKQWVLYDIFIMN